MKVVECVPNFSEGRDEEAIQSIAEAITSVAGVRLLDMSSGYDTNRTVYTFAGDKKPVLDAAYRAVERGSELIDMARHSGTHPRMGACDVCPFVPVSDVRMEECADLARRLGKRVGDSLLIPVYLYGYAATDPQKRELEAIRSGEYEGLCQKLNNPHWQPDFGPAECTDRVIKSGALITGAREFLIAYNLNLDTKDRDTAQRIAETIREKGRVVTDKKGREIRIPGKLKSCKAIGWYVEQYGKAQVSINLTNYRETNLHQVFEAAREEASRAGVQITGSEIVGLIPKEAITASGLYYLHKKGLSSDRSERELIEAAVQLLGLDELEPFIPERKIIEYRIGL